MIDLPSEQLNAVKRILAKHVPFCEVRAFGSRVQQTAKKWSDLDLVVVGSAKLEGTTLSDLKEAFEESTLPIRVDVLDWYAISPNFQSVINEGYEAIHEPA